MTKATFILSMIMVLAFIGPSGVYAEPAHEVTLAQLGERESPQSA